MILLIVLVGRFGCCLLRNNALDDEAGAYLEFDVPGKVDLFQGKTSLGIFH